MDARGFSAHSSRSDRHPTAIRSRDIVFVAAAWLIALARYLEPLGVAGALAAILLILAIVPVLDDLKIRMKQTW